MVISRLIRNFPITLEEVTTANTIFGPDMAMLKGETTRKYPDPMVTNYVEIKQHILDPKKEVTLAVDVMFVNGTGLFVSTSWWIKFTTLEYFPSHTKGRLGHSLKKLISIYNNSGFKIRTALIDREFDCLIPDFP